MFTQLHLFSFPYPRAPRCRSLSRSQIPQSNEGRHWFHYVDKTVTLDLLKQLTEEFLHIFDRCPTRLKSKMKSIRADASQSVGFAPFPPPKATFVLLMFMSANRMTRAGEVLAAARRRVRRRHHRRPFRGASTTLVRRPRLVITGPRRRRTRNIRTPSRALLVVSFFLPKSCWGALFHYVTQLGSQFVTMFFKKIKCYKFRC